MFGFQFSKEFKNRRIRKFGREIEPQEILLDRLAQEREKEFGFSEKKLEFPLSNRILQGVLFVFFVFLVVFWGRTLQLQVLEGEKFALLAEENKSRLYPIRTDRGVIYDRNLRQLVYNQPSFDLVLDIKDLPREKEKFLQEIEIVARIIQEDPQELKQKIEKSKTSTVLISENLDHSVLVSLETKMGSKELPGFRLEENTIRFYTEGPYFSHLLGYTGKISKEEFDQLGVRFMPNNYSQSDSPYFITDYIGKTGLEKFYEKILRGNPGVLKIERDAHGNLIKESIITNPLPGKSLVLWLDVDLQEKIAKELEKAKRRFGASGAAAVALDPKTGGILALVSLPSFDNNLFSQGITQKEWEKLEKDPFKPLFNRTISGVGYPVGSTIKPLVALAALEEGIISENTKLYCPLELCVKHIYTGEKECFEDWRFHGWTDVTRAIAESVNPFFYMVGGGYIAPDFADSRLPKNFKGLGVEKIKKYLDLFGWGKKAGIDLPAEAEGRVPDPEWKKNYFQAPELQKWYLGDTYHLSIGQGFISVTPLQVATAFSAIANGGTIFKPKMVQKILDSNKNVVKDFEPEILNKDFIDPQSLKIVRRGMREAVTYGSSAILNVLPVKVAAKTGTAQSSGDFYHHWATVFAPYEDPEIVLTLMIEDVKGAQFVALPVAKEVLEWYFSR